MRRGAMRKDAFFGAALLLVSAGPAESGVVAPKVERLPQRLGLHDLVWTCEPEAIGDTPRLTAS